MALEEVVGEGHRLVKRNESLGMEEAVLALVEVLVGLVDDL